MSEHRSQLDDTEVVVVTFAEPDALRRYQEFIAVPFPMVIDAGRRWYRRLGMSRGTLWQVWGPGNIAAYAKLMARGRRMQAATEDDTRQLGGDFVFDRDGRLVAAFPSASPDDRASVDRLIAATADL